MKRQTLFEEFCKEHDLWYGIPGDCAVIENSCCTEQEYFRFQALKCVGYCDTTVYRSFSDMNNKRDNLRNDENDLTSEDFDRFIESKSLYIVGEMTPKKEGLAWAIEKLRAKQLELFTRETSNPDKTAAVSPADE